MPGEIILFVYQEKDNLFRSRLAADMGRGIVATAENVPTLLRRTANKLTKMKVK